MSSPCRAEHRSVAVWITAVACHGVIEHLRIHPTPSLACWDLVQYLRSYHGYDGPDVLHAVQAWLQSRGEMFNVRIVARTLPRSRDGEHPVPRLDQHLRERGVLVQTGRGATTRNSSGSDPFQAAVALVEQLAACA